jgi:ferrochelatase
MTDAPALPGHLSPAPVDHPPVPRAKVGVILANLGTPDATDYWSMRRYLNEFLSDETCPAGSGSRSFS